MNQRVFTEKVSATMFKIIDPKNSQPILIRQNTKIQLGTTNKPIASVFMTNPGSFEFKNNPNWEEFKNGPANLVSFYGEDYPDLTMQMVIDVIRQSYATLRIKPNGVIHIYNISNVVQPSGEQAESYHVRAKKLVRDFGVDSDILEEPVVYCKERFFEICGQSRFVMMGFVRDVFEDQVKRLVDWSKEIKNRVVAVDKKGYVSHPRRWRTEPYLKQQAIDNILKVLSAS